MVGYGTFLMVLRGFFVDSLWVLQSFCGYLFHKPTHGFASFSTQILMKTHTKTQIGLCVTFPVCWSYV